MKPQVLEPVKWFDHFVIAIVLEMFLTQSASLLPMEKWYDHFPLAAAMTRFLTQSASVCELKVVRPLDGDRRADGALDAERS